MFRLNRVTMLVVLTALLAATAFAGTINVDGDDSEWGSPLASVDDPNGDVSNTYYDIDAIFADYDATANRLGFMTRTVAPMNHIDGADRVEFIFNADDDTTTGSPSTHGFVGGDYHIIWDLDGVANVAYDYTSGTNQPQFRTWTTSGWTYQKGLAADDLKIAWGDMGTSYSVIECTINPEKLGNPDEFVWGCYLDNGGGSNDDSAEGRVGGDDDSPEPATWVLLAATAVFGVLKRRRG